MIRLLSVLFLATVVLSACGTTGAFGDEYYQMDINHDRSLSRAEMTKHYPARIFNEMDIDGSGGVSPMEYRRYPNQNRNN
jgi:hypothetical protein